MPKSLEPFKYSATHKWVYKNLGKASEKKCFNCNKFHKRMEWANISGKYKRDFKDWKVLCNPCHQKFDNSGFYVLRKDKLKKLCVRCRKVFEIYPYREKTAKFCSKLCIYPTR